MVHVECEKRGSQPEFRRTNGSRIVGKIAYIDERRKINEVKCFSRTKRRERALAVHPRKQGSEKSTWTPFGDAIHSTLLRRSPLTVCKTHPESTAAALYITCGVRLMEIFVQYLIKLKHVRGYRECEEGVWEKPKNCTSTPNLQTWVAYAF